MSCSLPLFENILETFAVTTGVSAFLTDVEGNIQQTSKGFSPLEYTFADMEHLRHSLNSEAMVEVLKKDQYYTHITDNQFVYVILPVETKDARYIVIAGPLRFHPPTEPQLIALLKGNQIPLKQRDKIAEKIARLPEVSMVRLEHLGRELWSLCHAYTSKGTSMLPEFEFPADEPSALPRITFTLVEEDAHVSFKILSLIRDFMLSGNVAGVRALRKQVLDLPLDRLISKDDVRSARDNLISACGAFGGLLIFEYDIPYEQVMMSHDQYIRLGEQANSIPELVDLIFQALEAYTWTLRRYSTRQYTKPVRQVIQYIQADITRKVTLDDLVKLTGLSKSYLSRLIKRETGSSLVELVDSYRIEESKYLLQNTNYSIHEIAELTGFKYQYHFALRFKKHTSMTPTHYRQMEGGNPH